MAQVCLQRLFGMSAVAFALAWGIAQPPMAHADQVTNAPAADELFRQAVNLAKSKDFSAAIEKFRASYALDPARGTLQGLALAEEKLGRVASALAHFRELEGLSTRAGDRQRLAAARARIAALEPRVPRLTVLVPEAPTDPELSELTLDAVPLPSGALNTALPVDPGKHRIVARAADGSTFDLGIAVAEGESRSVRIVWTSAAPATRPLPTVPAVEGAAPTTQAPQDRTTDDGVLLRTSGLIVGGTGLAVLGVSAFVFVAAQSEIDEVASLCAGRGSCASVDQVERGNDARTRKSLGVYGMIGGGVLLGVGGTLFILGQSKTRSATALRAAVGPGSLTLSGRFH